MSAQVSGILLVAAFGIVAAACTFLAVRLVGLSSPGGRRGRDRG